jgi:hypothetical protein
LETGFAVGANDCLNSIDDSCLFAKWRVSLGRLAAGKLLFAFDVIGLSTPGHTWIFYIPESHLALEILHSDVFEAVGAAVPSVIPQIVIPRSYVETIFFTPHFKGLLFFVPL